MFSASVFKTVPCPDGPNKCKLINCLFSHEPRAIPSAASHDARAAITASVGDAHGDFKRRKLSDASAKRIVPEYDNNHQITDLREVANVSAQKPSTDAIPEKSASRSLASATRAISPPPSTQLKKASAAGPQATSNGPTVPAKKTPEKVETLNPRLVQKNSAPHAYRNKLLRFLHGELVRLNNEVRKSTDEKILSLRMSDNELVCMALDEEEDVAKKGSGLYNNMMNQKSGHYKKMQLDKWVMDRRKATKQDDVQASSDTPLNINTGLTHSEELQMLERFILSPKQMSLAGFILTPPSDIQVEDARKTIEASGGYETCDRCGTRFRVLAEPAENGSYTTNGKCTYHWGKPVFRKREKTDFITGPKEALYLCCNQPKGSPGCSHMDSHVFKIGSSNVGRLASVLQFQTTPLNTKAERIAIAFDCEMGYTTAGLEMIRLSACKWPSNEALIDVLVKPVGKVLDLNTKFSGVTPRQFNDAIEYDPEKHVPLPEPLESKGDGNGDVATQKMKIMLSPAATRSLLTQYISPNTVLIGHAIDNDLNVLRLLHPTIVDTSLLYPHHGGLPFRYALRQLAKDFLSLEIQTAGAVGHDSMEDSRATGDLVRVKVMKEWAKFKSQGWSVKDGTFYATIGGQQKVATLPPYTEGQGWSKKRKAEQEVPQAGQIGETVGLKELLK